MLKTIMDQVLPWGTPALTSNHSEYCPFNKTLGFLFLRKSQSCSEIPDIPFCFDLKMRPSFQTLPSTFDILRKIPLTSSNDLYFIV